MSIVDVIGVFSILVQSITIKRVPSGSPPEG